MFAAAWQIAWPKGCQTTLREKTLQTDFLNAHERHLDDAERLFQAGRLANADHLYGMASECGLKRLMAAFGMAVDSSGSPRNTNDRKHVESIWMRFESYRSGHHHGTGYPLSGSNPFNNWKAEQRYAHQGSFDAARVDPHRTGALEVRDLIRKALREGLI
ncbi:SAM-dependent methyltransferase [Azospirillum halopraeferens]|uniref:SAM-dependent methyltransferase n=1 Tax=Azospirillum halopraeferens TaxID=34010 RepID=UPI001FE06B24|nr:SAM-dependent methyltransferase [Azospirillum halopraeferens]